MNFKNVCSSFNVAGKSSLSWPYAITLVGTPERFFDALAGAEEHERMLTLVLKSNLRAADALRILRHRCWFRPIRTLVIKLSYKHLIKRSAQLDQSICNDLVDLTLDEYDDDFIVGREFPNLVRLVVHSQRPVIQLDGQLFPKLEYADIAFGGVSDDRPPPNLTDLTVRYWDTAGTQFKGCTKLRCLDVFEWSRGTLPDSLEELKIRSPLASETVERHIPVLTRLRVLELNSTPYNVNNPFVISCKRLGELFPNLECLGWFGDQWPEDMDLLEKLPIHTLVCFDPRSRDRCERAIVSHTTLKHLVFTGKFDFDLVRAFLAQDSRRTVTVREATALIPPWQKQRIRETMPEVQWKGEAAASP